MNIEHYWNEFKSWGNYLKACAKIGKRKIYNETQFSQYFLIFNLPIPFSSDFPLSSALVNTFDTIPNAIMYYYVYKHSCCISEILNLYIFKTWKKVSKRKISFFPFQFHRGKEVATENVINSIIIVLQQRKEKKKKAPYNKEFPWHMISFKLCIDIHQPYQHHKQESISLTHTLSLHSLCYIEKHWKQPHQSSFSFSPLSNG